jgi:hypothetical protein
VVYKIFKAQHIDLQNPLVELYAPGFEEFLVPNRENLRWDAKK